MSAKRQIRHLFSRMWRLPLVSVLDADTTFFSAFRSRAGVSFKGGLLSSPFDSMAQAMEVHSLRWIMSFPALSWIARPSSRRAALLPSQKRVTSVAFLLRLVWRVSTPGPKGKGAGVQNAGMRAPVGRRLRARWRRWVSGCVSVPLSVPPQHSGGWVRLFSRSRRF